MKIAYVITRSDVIGGASAHLLDLARGVQDRGHTVTLFVGGNGLVNRRAKAIGLECHSLNYLVREISLVNDFKGYRELKGVLAKFAPDLVHVHSAKAGILGRLVSKRLSIPVIYTAHGWPFTEGIPTIKRKVFALIEKIMAYWSDRIITVSDYDRRIALTAGVSSELQLVTVHNGIPDSRPTLARNGLVSEAGGNRDVKLVMVARFEQPKDQILLLKALAPLRGKKWNIEFVGDGPLLGSARQVSNALGLDEQVRFSGECEDVTERLNNSDVLLLISRWEGLPLTILEGMRASLPVIASDVGGVSEQVEDGVTGFLVPRDESAEITTAVERLLSDGELRRRMGLEGRAHYEEKFSYDQMLEKTLGVYRGVLQGRE